MTGQDLSRRRFVGLLGGLGATAAAGCAAVEPPASNPDNTAPSIDFSSEDEDRFVALYEAMAPALVEVHIPAAENVQQGGGSGFLLDDIGIVTNAHVVRDNEAVDLRFHDRKWREGTVVETDLHSDLAVIEATDQPDETHSLAFDDEIPPIGTEVMALGSPLGFGGSATAGIVSGVNRSLPSPSGFSIPAAIQTDAAVNPGNSGGPLVDLNGSVIGVVFAGAGENIGFAISAPLAERVLPVLADGDAYEHSYMGVLLMDVGPRIADANDLEEAHGIYIEEVLDGAPADGVLQGTEERIIENGQEIPVGGDVIVAIDGTETPHLDAFQAHLALETDPNQTIEIDLYRDGERMTTEMTLGTRPDAPDLP